MLEKILTTLVAVGVPALGLALRATRRNRLRQRVDEYLEMARRVASHDAPLAARYQQLSSEAAHLLVLREQRWVRRTIDGGAMFAVLFLTLPTAGLLA